MCAGSHLLCGEELVDVVYGVKVFTVQRVGRGTHLSVDEREGEGE